MEKGREFLRAQVNNAIMQHQTLLDNLETHVKQADDKRYRDLCTRGAASTSTRLRMLEEYGTSVGAEGASGVKKVLGAALGKARDAVDSLRETDFLRLVGDIVMVRQAQDTLATFAAVGEKIGEPRLSEIGRAGEREHDELQRELNQLVQTMFVDHVQSRTATDATGQRAEAP